MTQQELAQKSGVQQQTISQIENRPARCPRIDVVYALSLACGCSMYDMYVPEEKSDDVDGFDGN